VFSIGRLAKIDAIAEQLGVSVEKLAADFGLSNLDERMLLEQVAAMDKNQRRLLGELLQDVWQEERLPS